MFLLNDFILPNREISSSNTICQQCSANGAKENVFECVCVCKNPVYIQDVYLLNKVQTLLSANPHKVTTMYLAI